MSSQKVSGGQLQKVGTVFYVIVAVLAAVTLALYVMNVNQSYYQDMNGVVAAMVVGALACAVVAVLLEAKSSSLATTVVADVLRVAVPALVLFAGVTFVGMRAQSLGQIFGSNLELGNESAFAAGTQAIYTIVLFVVTWLVSVVAAFTKLGRRDAS